MGSSQAVTRDDAFAFPNTPTGPQALSRAELDDFGLVAESSTPARTIEKAEAFRLRYPRSQMLSLVSLNEMRAEIQVNSYSGAVAIGHEVLRLDPNNLEALVLMAQVLPDFPASYSGSRANAITEAENCIDAAQQLLRTFHLPAGASTDDFLRGKRSLEVSLHESAGFVKLVSGRYDDAIRDYEWVLQHTDSPSPSARLRLGLAYYNAGKLEAARAQLEQARQSGSDIVRGRAEEVLRAIDSGGNK